MNKQSTQINLEVKSELAGEPSREQLVKWIRARAERDGNGVSISEAYHVNAARLDTMVSALKQAQTALDSALSFLNGMGSVEWDEESDVNGLTFSRKYEELKEIMPIISSALNPS